MNKNLAKAKLSSAKNRVHTQTVIALERANAYLKERVQYKWGGKTEEALDCSGLTRECYPILLEGVENQYVQLRDWLFKEDELIFFEEGDLVFFIEKSNPTEVSHVGIVEKRNRHIAEIIHSSQAQGGVVKDNFNVLENTFRNSYLAIAVAKIRPFLFRRFLDDEIKRSLYNVG